MRVAVLLGEYWDTFGFARINLAARTVHELPGKRVSAMIIMGVRIYAHD